MCPIHIIGGMIMCVGIPIARKMMLPEQSSCAATSDDDNAGDGSNESQKSSRRGENGESIGSDGEMEEIESIEYELSLHRENFPTNK